MVIKLLVVLTLAVVPASWAQTTSLSLQASRWRTYQSGKKTMLNNDANHYLTFKFPGPGSSINYLFTKYTLSMTGRSSVSFTVQVKNLSGNPFYDWRTNPDNNCTGPVPAVYSHVRLYIEDRRDDGGGDYYRWWSNSNSADPNSAAYELDLASTATIEVPLDPHLWSSVYGEFADNSDASRKGFADALANVGYVGLTFGGGCFFGHGVFVSGGTASFTLMDYEIH